MPENQEYIQPLLEKLEADFELEASSLPVIKDYDEEMRLIKEFLTKRIKELMEHDYERFLNTLYRLDVNEDKASTLLNSKKTIDKASRLADLIIERQLQRVKTQILYKQGKL